MVSTMRHELNGLKQKWYLPQDKISEQVLIPAAASCKKFDCMSGYFSPAFLRELSHGLAKYLIETDQPLRLLISGEISAEDQDIIRKGLSSTELAFSVVQRAFEAEVSLADALIKHTKECLAYLVWSGRLEVRVVLMSKGMFHPKQFMFFDGDDIAVLSGSANATGHGLGANVEQLFLQRSWKNSEEAESCRSDIEFFDSYWQSKHPIEDSITVDLPEALKKNLLEKSYLGHEVIPTYDAYKRALNLANVAKEEIRKPVFEIPPWLVWESGDFKHQGEAVMAWEDANHTGILAMATGSGKTLTSLIAAQRLSDNQDKLLIVIAVPKIVLIKQWESEVLLFGLQPYAQDSQSASHHLREVDRRIHNLELGMSRVEIVIITLNLLNHPKMQELLTRNSKIVLLIADEMHNLGTEKFIKAPPNVKYKLGLSATPRRQYDDEGSDALFDYFGAVVFEFSLEQAIGVCLVPYDYFIHEVQLTEKEMEKYVELSAEIRQRMAKIGGWEKSQGDAGLQRLLEKRARILESAEKKIDKLKSLLEAEGPDKVKHTLIYCTDKDPEQLQKVNLMLRELNIRFHQITDEESGDREKVKEILEQFKMGNLAVLTAKRILDEGFNIPEIATAYVLASNTVERQWTQRRGRVLRICKAINKEYATIHDFVAVPPAGLQGDPDAARIIERELKRANEFARICRNKDRRDSPYIVIRELERRFLVYVREQGI